MNNSGVSWSDDDTILLNQCININMPFKEIAILLKRSPRSVRYKYIRLLRGDSSESCLSNSPDSVDPDSPNSDSVDPDPDSPYPHSPDQDQDSPEEIEETVKSNKRKNHFSLDESMPHYNYEYQFTSNDLDQKSTSISTYAYLFTYVLGIITVCGSVIYKDITMISLNTIRLMNMNSTFI